MENQNVAQFTVDGVGTFKYFKETPAPKMFLDRRRKVAEILGMKNLLECESLIEENRESKESLLLQVAVRASFELNRAYAFVDMRELIIDTPKDFNWDTVKPEDFTKIMEAFNKARGFFREGDSGEAKGSAQAPESPVGRKEDKIEKVPA